MSEEENKRLYAHYASRASGSYKTANPSNPVRDELVKSDAKRHLADLIKKNPGLEIKEEPVVLVNAVIAKSKGKKNGRE